MKLNRRGEWIYEDADIDLEKVRQAMSARAYGHVARGPHSPRREAPLAGPRPSPAGVTLSPEERAQRRRESLQAARDTLAAAPPAQPAVLHAYGPHDPSARRQTEMVYPTGVKWPTKFEDEISPKIQAQWAALNNRAHREARERLLLAE